MIDDTAVIVLVGLFFYVIFSEPKPRDGWWRNRDD